MSFYITHHIETVIDTSMHPNKLRTLFRPHVDPNRRAEWMDGVSGLLAKPTLRDRVIAIDAQKMFGPYFPRKYILALLFWTAGDLLGSIENKTQRMYLETFCNDPDMYDDDESNFWWVPLGVTSPLDYCCAFEGPCSYNDAVMQGDIFIQLNIDNLASDDPPSVTRYFLYDAKRPPPGIEVECPCPNWLPLAHQMLPIIHISRRSEIVRMKMIVCMPNDAKPCAENPTPPLIVQVQSESPSVSTIGCEDRQSSSSSSSVGNSFPLLSPPDVKRTNRKESREAGALAPSTSPKGSNAGTDDAAGARVAAVMVKAAQEYYTSPPKPSGRKRGGIAANTTSIGESFNNDSGSSDDGSDKDEKEGGKLKGGGGGGGGKTVIILDDSSCLSSSEEVDHDVESSSGSGGAKSDANKSGLDIDNGKAHCSHGGGSEDDSECIFVCVSSARNKKDEDGSHHASLRKFESATFSLGEKDIENGTNSVKLLEYFVGEAAVDGNVDNISMAIKEAHGIRGIIGKAIELGNWEHEYALDDAIRLNGSLLEAIKAAEKAVDNLVQLRKTREEAAGRYHAHQSRSSSVLVANSSAQGPTKKKPRTSKKKRHQSQGSMRKAASIVESLSPAMMDKLSFLQGAPSSSDSSFDPHNAIESDNVGACISFRNFANHAAKFAVTYTKCCKDEKKLIFAIDRAYKLYHEALDSLVHYNGKLSDGKYFSNFGHRTRNAKLLDEYRKTGSISTRRFECYSNEMDTVKF